MNKGKKLNNIQELIPSTSNKVETLSRVVNSYFTVIGTEGIGTPEDHYEQLEILKHANKGELFVCTLSSNPGGDYSGILAWKSALEGTEAHTVAILEGDLASAATIIPLFFDEIIVQDFTTFMVHSANLGIGRGTACNVERNAAFQAKQVQRFIREVYRGFLDDTEIQKVLDGVELYMDDEEIRERLAARDELLAAEEAKEGCEDPTCPCHEEEEPSTEDSVAEEQQ